MFNLFFIVVASIIFVRISQKNILWGLGLIIIFLPSYLWRFKILGLPSTFLEVMILLSFFIWIIKNKNYKKIFWQDLQKEKKWLYFAALWTLVGFWGYLNNIDLKSLGLWRAYFLEPLLFFIVLLTSLKNLKDYRFIIKALATLVFWLAIFAVVQNFTGANLPSPYDYPNVKRLTSIFSYPNALSLLTIGISGFLIAYYFCVQRKWEYLVVGLLGVFLSWWSVSQGALVALAIAFIIFAGTKVLRLIQNKKQKYILCSFVLAGALVFFGSQIWSSFYQQLFHPVLDLQASSLEIRSSQWQETWAMLKDNWFKGAGLNAYQFKLIPYHRVSWLEIFLYPHNIFLNFWSELGIFGLLLFLLFLYFIVREIRGLFLFKHQMAWPLLIFWVIWLVQGLVDVPYFKNDLSLLFFIFIALTIKAKSVKQDLQSGQILV